jgi:large subunit ribosomal protein L15
MANTIRIAGKRIVDLQTTLALLTASTSVRHLKDTKDPFGRQPFEHPALEQIECLNGGARDVYTHHKQLSTLAQRYGLQDVVRWVPKKVRSLCQTNGLISRLTWPFITA